MADDGEDPFDEFEAPDDEDDPFEDLAPPDDDRASDDPSAADSTAADTAETSSAPGRLPDDPFDREQGAEAGPDADRDPDRSPGGDAGGDAANEDTHEPTDDPFAEFSTARREEGEDPFEAFESAGVDGIDPDAVWEELEGGESGTDERTYSEVSKHRFCEGCEHFSPPPDIECTYEGAAIVEFLDTETVRLLNCPIVAEQRALEGSGVDLGADSE